jgi:hypothetical protein
MKPVKWQKLLVKATIWLAAEITLNLLGIDDLADYTEFVERQKKILLFQLDLPVILINENDLLIREPYSH